MEKAKLDKMVFWSAVVAAVVALLLDYLRGYYGQICGI